MSYNLFLDDIRMPYDVGNYIYPVELRQYFRKYEWVIVRNYDEFVKHIVENGMPHVVSFDHDLADEHYDPSKRYKEKTGYDCAKWMIDFSKSYMVNLPKLIMCHSMNPVGKENIVKLFHQR
jgi:hypothetical protein